MSKTVKVSYNAETLETIIVVDGKEFDTSRINGKEIADWAYPFMVRKVRWDGFYDEMVAAHGGEKAFDLIFEGSEEALAELKEAWEDAPVNVVSGEQNNIVTIAYDADALITEITVNGQPFDTSRINGKEIEDWVSPFMMRKIKWDGIFDELKAVLGSDEYDIQFSGTRTAMKILMEECPETVTISFLKGDKPAQSKNNPTKAVSSQKKSHPLMSVDEYSTEKYNELWENEDYEALLPIVRAAAESGNMEAQADLALMYQLGWGVDIDIIAAEKWYLKAAEQGDSSCMESLAQIYAGQYNGCEKLKNSKKAEEWFKKAEKATVDKSEFDYYAYYSFLEDEGRNNDAFEVMKRGANNGRSEAMRDLAYVYYFGDKFGESEDIDKAVKWLEKAANAGDALSMTLMAQFCIYGTCNVEENEELGFQYLLSSLEIDDSIDSTHLLLGKCFLNGWGTDEDVDAAIEHLQKAADNDSIEAMYWLGIAYRIVGDESEAAEWLKIAADNDYEDAVLEMGYMYLYGYGIEQNYKLAYELFKKAADYGNAKAQYAIGDMYEEGEYVQQNYAMANEWYCKAMNQGNADAKAMYGINCYCGNGIKRDKNYGAQLIKEAASEGCEFADGWVEKYEVAYKEGFKKGFKKTMKMCSGVLKVIGNVSGHPEFGIAGTAMEKTSNSILDGDFSSALDSAKKGYNKLFKDAEEENDEEE